MRRERRTKEEVNRILLKADRLIAEGGKLSHVLKQLKIGAPLYYRHRDTKKEPQLYAGMVSDVLNCNLDNKTKVEILKELV